ncbi:hypothetical protein P0F76_21040, partial [Pseudomonas paraeruginosa]
GLVGSENCIRDRATGAQPPLPADEVQKKLNLFDDGGSLKLDQIRGN